MVWVIAAAVRTERILKDGGINNVDGEQNEQDESEICNIGRTHRQSTVGDLERSSDMSLSTDTVKKLNNLEIISRLLN